MRGVKVLHINDYAAAGGAEVLMNATIALLRSAGVKAQPFTLDDVPGFRLHPLGYVSSGRCAAALRRRLDSFRPDLVHLHNWYHGLSPSILPVLSQWKRATGCRVLMTAHDYHLVCPNSGLRHFRGGEGRIADPARAATLRCLLTRRWDHRGAGHSMLKLAQHLWHYRLLRRQRVIDEILCPSRFMQSVLARRGFSTVFLPNPAPPPRTPSPGASPRSSGGPLRLIFAGRIEPEKGLLRLLEMMPDRDGWTLQVVGDGGDLAACGALVARRGWSPRVEFLGPRPREEAMEHIAAAHVLVLPSVWLENAPMSLLEALACGTNILTADHGGMREVVHDSGVGFLFDPSDPATLHRVLEDIIKAHRAGTLNRFDAEAWLTSRGEPCYLRRLVDIYRNTRDRRGGNA
jgi:glycosyltransferase involved in cell wall biosynthesis